MSGDQSLTKSWDLSLYELHRTPQESINDNTEIAVSPRSLHSELMCPICLDMLKNTMTTKECLHRFCSECIVTALRSGNKECPTCRKKLVSKRSLRPDPNFDMLISKIYPSRDEYEAMQEKVLAKLKSKSSQMFEELAQQHKQRQQRQKKMAADMDASLPLSPGPPSSPIERPTGSNLRTKRSRITSDNESGAEDTTDSESRAENRIPELDLVFKPHPVEMGDESDWPKALKDNSVRYLKTTANATVEHLSKYLEVRLTLGLGKKESSGIQNFCISVSYQPGQYTLLKGSETLIDIQKILKRENEPIELLYSWKK
ncbi:E3 ubiquitin-protein ligase RING2-like [Artemia franciscana]|uniref:RING-type E3 ubiquitin transferase n=1 Tax=Artemia franciscana TaxID=6661 RepID=A0AA88L3D7_ARTSF|nr:hypothetical protein QYM36_012400 [Artemia franciscana]KAK2711206.1 hypothetical protein QYM36_012400 [Artemia franciscana]KAK2711207.1 hypothetical protein QYM36_012400 [Artemia franciscana]KAK2711208.1 hypothetical protein QYM36_012400 [Artemia franciscana]KAK2711209.1 hypothetical protein QYM36_012400 [Artemia franciscana]